MYRSDGTQVNCTYYRINIIAKLGFSVLTIEQHWHCWLSKRNEWMCSKNSVVLFM